MGLLCYWPLWWVLGGAWLENWASLVFCGHLNDFHVMSEHMEAPLPVCEPNQVSRTIFYCPAIVQTPSFLPWNLLLQPLKSVVSWRTNQKNMFLFQEASTKWANSQCSMPRAEAQQTQQQPQCDRAIPTGRSEVRRAKTEDLAIKERPRRLRGCKTRSCWLIFVWCFWVCKSQYST